MTDWRFKALDFAIGLAALAVAASFCVILLKSDAALLASHAEPLDLAGLRLTGAFLMLLLAACGVRLAFRREP
jgi:hypothetical protein